MGARDLVGRIVSINPDIGTQDAGHTLLHYQYEAALYREARRLGMEYSVIGCVNSQPPEDFPAPLFPVLHEYRISMSPADWPAIWRGAVSRQLERDVVRALEQMPAPPTDRPRTAFFLYHGHPARIAGLIRVGLALRGASPIVLNLYHLHALYGPNRPASVPGLRELLQVTKDLRRVANVHLRVDSARLADFIWKDTGEAVPVLPFFSPSGNDPVDAAPPRRAGGRYRLAYPTATSGRDKGFDLVVGLAERLGRNDVEILARETIGESSEICLPTRAAIANGLTVLPSFHSCGSYMELLEQSDLILVPYPHWQFLTRTSGVVADAIRFAKPMVGTADCWIGDQIAELGAGTTFRDADVDDFVAATRQALERLDQLSESLREKRQSWLQRNSLAAFLHAVRDADNGGHAVIGRLKSTWYRAKVYGVTHGVLHWRHRVIEPGRIAINRLRLALRGRIGCLSLSIADRPGKWHKFPAVVWRTKGVDQVELRLDAPDGFPITKGGACGIVWMTIWLPDSSWIYLQDISDGKPLLAQHTLARMRYWRVASRLEGWLVAANRVELLVAWRFLLRCLRALSRLRQSSKLALLLRHTRLDRLWRPPAPAVTGEARDKQAAAAVLAAVGDDPDEWAITLPFTSGEVFLICAYARAFLERHGGSRVVVMAPRSTIDVVRLFPDAPVRGVEISRQLIEDAFGNGVRLGRLIKLDYGYSAGGRSKMQGRHSPMKSGFVQLFLKEAGLAVEDGVTMPRVTADIRHAAAERLHRLGLVEGRTAIIAPMATSLRLLPVRMWRRIAEVLSRRGFSVATNCGPGESPIPGTVPWTSSLSELYAATELGGFLITLRSGLCDLCSTAETAMHILMENQVLAPWPGITVLSGLAENGLRDDAVYHIKRFGESPMHFAERILAHPDLMAPSLPARVAAGSAAPA